MSEFIVIWSGAIETAGIRSAQMPPPLPPQTEHKYKLAVVRERVRSFLKRHPNATKKALMDNLGYHGNAISDALYHLRRKGVVERIAGRNERCTMWRLRKDQDS
jgi:DNA-binding MarR family transcriptional regulator